MDINHIVTETEANELMAKTKPEFPMHRFLLAMLYLTGARPSELLQLRRLDFSITDEGYNVVIPTAKLGERADFQIRTRTLQIRKDMPFFLQIDSYLLDLAPEERLLPRTVYWVSWLVTKLSEGRFCSYNFRHSRLTKLARQGANISDLMSWKGAKDARSVSAYLAAKPYEGKFKVD